MSDNDAPPKSYSTADVARRLGVSVPTVQRWVDLGHLKAWKTVGGHRRLDADSADRFIARQSGHEPGHGGAAAEPVAAQVAAQVAALAADPPPMSVLVVDDNPDDRDLVSALVEAALPGATVNHAENGFEALVAIGHSAPDVVITDIMMPNMNGFEMLRHLATSSSVRPRLIVAVSGLAPERVAALGDWPLAVKVVGKPIDPRLFIETLKAGIALLAAPPLP